MFEFKNFKNRLSYWKSKLIMLKRTNILKTRYSSYLNIDFIAFKKYNYKDPLNLESCLQAEEIQMK